MARFLFVMVPLTSHVNPALAIASALAEGGHEVAWCGPESDLRPLVGPDTTVYPTGKRYYRQRADTGMDAVKTLWDGYLIPLSRFILPAADRAIVDYRPDVVVVDQYAVSGALMALRHGARWASLCTGAMELCPPRDDLPGLDMFVRDALARVWAMGGMPVDETVDLRFSPHLIVALTSAALLGAAPVPPQCALTGPALGARPDDPGFPWDRWDATRAHVLVTVGTSSEHMAIDFYTRMARALAPMADRVQAVMIASDGALDDPPPHVLIVPRVPMLALLPRLDAVVCHGGQGTVCEALAFGVPLVVAPMRHDQPIVARQVVTAGAGVEVPFDAAEDALGTALAAVLDEPRYRAAARRIGESFADAGGARAAAAHLAALAADGPA